MSQKVRQSACLPHLRTIFLLYKKDDYHADDQMWRSPLVCEDVSASFYYAVTRKSLPDGNREELAISSADVL